MTVCFSVRADLLAACIETLGSKNVPRCIGGVNFRKGENNSIVMGATDGFVATQASDNSDCGFKGDFNVTVKVTTELKRLAKSSKARRIEFEIDLEVFTPFNVIYTVYDSCAIISKGLSSVVYEEFPNIKALIPKALKNNGVIPPLSDKVIAKISKISESIRLHEGVWFKKDYNVVYFQLDAAADSSMVYCHHVGRDDLESILMPCQPLIGENLNPLNL